MDQAARLPSAVLLEVEVEDLVADGLLSQHLVGSISIGRFMSAVKYVQSLAAYIAFTKNCTERYAEV